MPFIEWDDSLNVGVGIIDADHRAAVDLVNRMVEADDAAFPALFAEFAEHLSEHFGHEEALMEKYGFFAYDCHKGEHVRVLAEAAEIGQRLKDGDLAAARAYVRETVPAWFLNHRGTMDLVTAEFVRRFES